MGRPLLFSTGYRQEIDFFFGKTLLPGETSPILVIYTDVTR